MMGTSDDLRRWLLLRIGQIRKEQEPYGCYCQIPGCKPEELDQFVARVQQTFGVHLPGDFLVFLSIQNGGGEHAGLYGTRTYHLNTPGGDAHVEGFVEENQRLRGDSSPFNDLLVYGTTDLDYIVQDINTGKFRLRSKIGGDYYDELADMAAVIKFAMT